MRYFTKINQASRAWGRLLAAGFLILALSSAAAGQLWAQTTPASFAAGQLPVEQAESGQTLAAASLALETGPTDAAVFLKKGTAVPLKMIQPLSTAIDNQPIIALHLLSGDDSASLDNKTSFCRFEISGYQPGPAGVPQIEMTIDINQSGLVTLTAVDKTTGRPITINEKDSSVQRLDDLANDTPDDSGQAIGGLPISVSFPGTPSLTEGILGLNKGGFFSPILDKGASLPTQLSLPILADGSNQTSIPLTFGYTVESEAIPQILARIAISGYSPAPAGEETQVLLVIKVDESGQVTVWAKDIASGAPLEITRQ